MIIDAIVIFVWAFCKAQRLTAEIAGNWIFLLFALYSCGLQVLEKGYIAVVVLAFALTALNHVLVRWADLD